MGSLVLWHLSYVSVSYPLTTLPHLFSFTRRLGGVKGTLQKRATEVYEGLSGEEQEAAKQIFLELTQLGEGTEDTRRRVLLRDLTGENREQVIQKLVDARLIVTQEEIRENQKFVVVDVAHEALIRHWLLLRKWLDENRDRLREKRKIEAAAQEWRNFSKGKDYLFKGGQLKKAKAWLSLFGSAIAFGFEGLVWRCDRVARIFSKTR
jgi:hypothetical protein